MLFQSLRRFQLSPFITFFGADTVTIIRPATAASDGLATKHHTDRHDEYHDRDDRKSNQEKSHLVTLLIEAPSDERKRLIN
jgi:hypothetical protein